MIRPKGAQRSRNTDSVAWSDYGGAVSDLAYGDGEYPQPAHNPCGSGGLPDLASMVLSSRPPAVANPIKAKQSEADNLRQRGGDRPPRPVI
jgi:hypothetical protein